MPERDGHAESRRGTHARAAGWAGLFGAPLVGLLLYALLGGDDSLSEPARRVAAIAGVMTVLWLTEALPLAVTALLPLALFEPLGVTPMRDAAAPYADPIIFLFMGGFMIALAMERWGLHRRLALSLLRVAGTRLSVMVGAFMLASAALSMWVSNTATAVMMLPLGISVIAMLPEDSPASGRFAPCLLLAIAYSCSIGGLATLIGTPPNVVLAGFVREAYGFEIAFGQWMLLGLPLSLVFLVIAWLLLTRVLFPLGKDELPGGPDAIRAELRGLGSITRGETLTLIVFGLTAILWITRKPLSNAVPALDGLSDAQIAIAAAVLLFAIPVHPKRGVFVLDWKTAVRLPWDVLLLFGGGLSLAAAVRATGLDAWIAESVSGLAGAPDWLVALGVAALVVFLTELTSNTATATVFLPLLAGAAAGLGVDPLVLLVPAAIASSCAFMLPVATPPNAIIFSSGRLSIPQMARAGFVLNLVSIVLATIAAVWLTPLILGTIE